MTIDSIKKGLDYFAHKVNRGNIDSDGFETVPTGVSYESDSEDESVYGTSVTSSAYQSESEDEKSVASTTSFSDGEVSDGEDQPTTSSFVSYVNDFVKSLFSDKRKANTPDVNGDYPFDEISEDEIDESGKKSSPLFNRISKQLTRSSIADTNGDFPITGAPGLQDGDVEGAEEIIEEMVEVAAVVEKSAGKQINNTFVKIGGKSIVYPFAAVLFTHPFVNQSRKIAMGIKTEVSKKQIGITIPNFKEAYKGASRALAGKFPTQATFIGSKELMQDWLLKNNYNPTTANALSTLFATIAQNEVKSFFTYCEFMSLLHPDKKVIPYFQEQISKEGIVGVVKKINKGIGWKVTGDGIFYLPLFLIAPKVIKDTDPIVIQISKAAIVGGAIAATSYPAILLQTLSIKNAQQGKKITSYEIIAELFKEGKELAKGEKNIIKKVIKQCKPFWKGGGAAVKIMPGQSVALYLTYKIVDTIFDSEEKK